MATPRCIIGRPTLGVGNALARGWTALVQTRLGLTALLLSALTLSTPTGALGAQAAADASLEYPVKANYLVKFASFVQWPAESLEPGSPVMVCILGADPFGSVLDRAAGAETVGGHRLMVRRLDRVDARSGCQLVYLGASPEQTTGQALAALAGAPVLTVTDSARGVDRGIIHFAVSGHRVRFHIDDRRAARAGLSISSRLLNLALSVRARGSA